MWKGIRAQFFSGLFLENIWACIKTIKYCFRQFSDCLLREGRVEQHLLWVKNIKMAESDKLLLKSLS